MPRSLYRKLIINPKDCSSTAILDSDGQIEYPHGRALVWHREGTGFIFDYHTGSKVDSLKKVRLNDLLGYGEWSFVPVKSGFVTRVRENEVAKAEIQLDIPKLRESELEILASLHEVGHADFYNQAHQYAKRAQLLNSNHSFGEQLVEADRLLGQMLREDYEEISEILAWKKALLYDARYSILPHFSAAEKAACVRKYLGSYLNITKTIWIT